MQVVTNALNDDHRARAALEALRWPQGPVCPRRTKRTKSAASKLCAATGEDIRPIAATNGKRYRAGLYHCKRCRRQFTVTIGTILEGSKAPLSAWWRAVDLLSSGTQRNRHIVTVTQIGAATGLTYKSAWKMVQTVKTAAATYPHSRNHLGKPIKRHLSETPRARLPWLGKEYWYEHQRMRPLKRLPSRPAVNDTEALQDISLSTKNLMLHIITLNAASKAFAEETNRVADETKWVRSRGIGHVAQEDDWDPDAPPSPEQQKQLDELAAELIAKYAKRRTTEETEAQRAKRAAQKLSGSFIPRVLVYDYPRAPIAGKGNNAMNRLAQWRGGYPLPGTEARPSTSHEDVEPK